MSDWGVGYSRALMAAQGVGFEPAPHLDGDAYAKFVRGTMDLVMRGRDDFSEDFVSGVSEGAVAAWERRIAQEIAQ
jgi:hypothetical protein